VSISLALTARGRWIKIERPNPLYLEGERVENLPSLIRYSNP